jgi:hypothetical protein
MTIIPLTDCCMMLGIDPKTLRHWLKLTSMQFVPHPADARLKCLTLSQIQQLATLHDRPFPFSGSAPPALQETAPALGLSGEYAQASPESQAHLVQAAPLLPPSLSQEADLRKHLSCLEKSVTSMQEQLAQLALELLQERSLRYECRLSALEAHLHSKLDVPASGYEQEAQSEVPPPESLSTTGRRLHPAELRARSRVIPLIEYGAADTYVVICPQEGALELVPDSPEWFEWFATISSFRFMGQQGRFTAYRESKHGRSSRSWRAHHWFHQHNYKHSLGVTDQLTMTRLEQVAAILQAHVDAL